VSDTLQNDSALVKQAEKSLLNVLGKYQKSLQAVLGDEIKQRRFMWLIVNNIRGNPALLGCTPLSFINAVMLASQMKIEIRRNSAYLIPYGKECQLLVDYRSKLDLARRSGQIGGITLNLVYEGDEFEYEETARGVVFRHKPLQYRSRDGKLWTVPVDERGEVVLGYSLARLTNAQEPQIDIMSLGEIEGIRRRAKSGAGVPFNHYGKTMPALSLAEIRKLDVSKMAFRDPYRLPWITDWNQMARKTLAHRGANYWPQSPELALSQDVDDGNDTGNQPMAIGAEELADVMDPVDNQPLVQIPDNPDEQRQAQGAIAEQKITELSKATQKRGRPPKQEPEQAPLVDIAQQSEPEHEMSQEEKLFWSIPDRRKMWDQFRVQLGQDRYQQIVNDNDSALNFVCYQAMQEALKADKEQPW